MGLGASIRGSKVILDDCENDLGKALGNGLSHSGAGLRIGRTESEGLFTSLSRGPLGVRVPDAIGALMETRAKGATFCL